MIQISGELRGQDDVKRKLRAFRAQFPTSVAARATEDELNIDKKESMKRTPVDRGWARDSHRVEVQVRGDRVTGRIIAGDARTAGYIIPLHENLDAFHPRGQAKFLESVILESRPYYASRLRARMAMYMSQMSLG